MSSSTRCWHCSGKLVNRWGSSTPTETAPLLFAEVLTPLDQRVRVHKICATNAKFRPVTASDGDAKPRMHETLWNRRPE